jgi:hypothetical protein
MNVIKKSYHPLRMRNKWNEVASVCGNRTINMLVLVIYNGL